MIDSRQSLRSKIRDKLAVGELASELAHQLNNPLEALTNLIYIAKENTSDHQLRATLDEAEIQVSRITTIVHSLVTLKTTHPDQRLHAAGKVLTAEAFRRIKMQYESALHLASIIEGAQDAIYSKKLDGTIMAWNPEAERLFGYTSEEALGRSVRMLIPPGMADEENRILEDIRAGKRVARFDTTRRAKDGGDVRVSVTISPIKNTSGRVVGASTIAREILEAAAGTF